MGGKLWSADNGPTMVGQSIYDESSTPKASLGARLQLGDRTFRYCLNGTVALTPGTLTQGPVQVTGDKNCAVYAAASAGATTVTLTIAAGAVNAFADGYLGIYDVNASVGMTYRIKSNTVVGSGRITFTLYDALVVALTTSDKAVVARSKYNGVLITPATTPTAQTVGVPIINITASYYFWAQVKGPCTVLHIGTMVFGIPVVRGVATAGSVTVQVAGAGSLANDEVGVCLCDGATTKYGLVDLKIE